MIFMASSKKGLTLKNAKLMPSKPQLIKSEIPRLHRALFKIKTVFV